MAIHSEAPDHLGQALADGWSETGQLYRPGEVKDKWNSFKQEGNPTGQITILSLFELAYENKWDGKIKLTYVLQYFPWLESQESIQTHSVGLVPLSRLVYGFSTTRSS